MPEGIEAEAWLDLGAVGAVLLIVLVIVVLVFRQQSSSVDKLCSKIDVLVTSFADTSRTLSEVIVANDKDQKEVLRKLDAIMSMLVDVHKRSVRIDARMFDHTHGRPDRGPEIDEDEEEFE